jgi:hypothetical protein
MKLVNIFPLTICYDVIPMKEDKRKELVNYIEEQKNKPKGVGSTASEGAWTGDVHGFEFLLNDDKFKDLRSLISSKIYDYLNLMSVNSDIVDLYIQRSWGTHSSKGESIKKHSHLQSHISFVYYLLKSKGSGGINFWNDDPQNASCKNLFVSEHATKSVLKSFNICNSPNVSFDFEQDIIAIFPSKSSHSTGANISGDKRVSISGDIVMMLKKSKGFEHLMPNFKHWKKLDDRR